MVTTKSGNQYNNENWKEMMSEWSRELNEGADYLEGCEEIVKVAAKKLVEFAGVAPEKSYSIAFHISEEGIEGIQFSSPEKQAAVEEIDKWMRAEERKIR
jgi:hypothetical protein